MVEAELLFKDLTSYLKADDVSRLQRAYAFSEAAHHGQFRKSGEPYISHPLAVAKILAQWHLDPQALTAALLHDVMEDTAVTKEEIAESFGKPVAELVDGVSKIDAIEFQSKEDFQAENFRKMLLAMARDVRVILIKLADRLHNMRTMQVMDPVRKKRIARETLDIYAPIANRLGLNSIYQELDDLSFRYLHPTRYRVLAKALKTSRGNRREVVGKVLEAILARLKEGGIDASVTGREKHLYSIYNKMLEKQLSFAQVQDIYGFRVIVKDVPSCYLTLGVLHGLYKPFPGKFKDYIAIPKANGYQSLHTTLFGPFGMPLEVQIRTHEMHKIAEAGVASHWLYKTSDADLNELHRKTHQWLQSLLELQTTSGTAVEFLEHLKVDLFPDEVYVFTPKGKIMALPRGATAVDFAYFVHTDIGNRAIAVKINDELMPLRTELKNGDRVDIIMAVQARPNPAWLNFVTTARARSQIRHFLKTMQLEESVLLGERLLNQALATLKGTPAEIAADSWEKYLRESGAKSKADLYADIGLGKRLAAVVAASLLQRSGIAPSEQQMPGTILIRGTEGMAAQLARCCNPIPGDPVIGLVSKGQGIVIHTQDCPVIRKSRHESDRWVDVQWDDKTRRTFLVNIRLSVANERGVLARVAGGIAEAGSNIDNVSVEQSDSSAYSTMNFTLQVTNRFHLAQIMKRLRLIPEVVRIVRVKGPPRERDQ
ncbi:MAG: bifunctional (p)ppGpp synthetase/guanosine-3',5'-bis(diphosphate) 3'-pyrophosphohydrolase [Rhodocyclaceae bacterium]|jgi:guanosine-3',5'-bis(diphosphate) 3'-pyrophosphohydrolase|nr:bifunctional (p)ppGpp synthetase/guanosine-3',5'-bis(diphosphate) 3'-pyrophosphohydrolase [Rhodocyclaceae bacterium]MCA3074969.1 bifunctional (p)ppGpp synthetase/guanosine-3',5'-bis(diphosphate) 3'-pyrophosphohydrolase [Rhodocyclaceae bacterium]MCA3090447.1 bifunctional (p)ppGpp synthetase/guanosine-3',5'-bis(diphosphate) 3'-pyrophosphohydrolase [Rhodocyclaceae bacterium]MCA3094673.1 bifunctional (p)ppGpp synthetase/guanosine-3',5'-bis(diphosphate) 3'-pyrophosphohydrolase [Rhodocyclaceae bact